MVRVHVGEPSQGLKDSAASRTYGSVEPVTRHARLEQIMREVVEPVRRYLARRTDAATADDVLSETLVVLWRRIDDVPDDPIPWAIGIARLQLANAQRAARRQARLAAKVASTDPPQPAPDHAASDTGYILDAIARLKPAEAELVRLWAWDDLDLEQIAQILGVSTNAATIRLHRARKKLKDLLGDGHAGVKEGDRT
jgi:RNA polymerase sigma-70 factor, ECF subfamily